MSRVVLSILRQAAEPLTSRDIALQMLVERALDKSDQRLLRLMTKRVGVALRIQRDNGAVLGLVSLLPNTEPLGSEAISVISMRRANRKERSLL